MKKYQGAEVDLHTFLTLALDVSDHLLSSECFTPGTHLIWRFGKPQRWSEWRREKSLLLLGSEPVTQLLTLAT
jgi:hypothetical protein